MKLEIKCILFSMLFLGAYNTSLNAQVRNYDVVAFDDIIGEASITKKVISDTEYKLEYSFDAIIKVLFIKTTVVLNMNGTYNQGQIVEADVFYKTNEKKFLRDYIWKDSVYEVTTNNKATSLSKRAYFSIMNFYEKEPIGITEVFLEKQNEFVPLKILGNHQYRVKVDGDDCTYTYKDGILQELFVDGIVNLYIRLRK